MSWLSALSTCCDSVPLGEGDGDGDGDPLGEGDGGGDGDVVGKPGIGVVVLNRFCSAAENEVPSATDTPPQPEDITLNEDWQEEQAEFRRQQDEGELRPITERHPFPPTRYEEE